MPQEPWIKAVLLWGLVAPATYLVLLTLGRWLRRRQKVQLDASYHFFAICLALLLPLRLLKSEAGFFKFVEAIAVLSGTLFSLALIRRFFWEYYFEEKQRIPIPRFIREVVALAVFVIALVLVITFIYEIKIPGLLAGSGIVAVILGLAMQDTLGNIVAGIAIHFEKPFKPGDWLIIENRPAEVMEVNWRATRLRTNDNICLDIPNNQLAKQTITNLNYPTRLYAMRLTIGLDYQVPPNEVKDALLAATKKAEGISTQRPPKVFLTTSVDSALLYEVKFWMEDHSRYNDVVDAIRTNIWYELRRRQIKLPYPTRTLFFGSAPDIKPSLLPARELLRQQPIFQCLDEQNLDSLLSGARLYRFGRGEKVIEQDAEGSSMFVLVRGEAAVFVSTNGQITRVADLRVGDCFGEMSLLTGEKRRATVLASTDCDALEIEKPSLAAVFQQEPEILRRLSELLAKRQMENEQVRNQQSLKKFPGTEPAGVRKYIPDPIAIILRAVTEVLAFLSAVGPYDPFMQSSSSLSAIGNLERPSPMLLRYYFLKCLLTGPAFPFAFIPHYFKYHTLRYRFDNEGISMRWGILFRREIILNYSRIQDIHLSSNLIERWLGLAKIEIQTAAGSASAEMSIEGIVEFEAVRDFLYAQMRGTKDSHKTTHAGPGTSVAPNQIAEEELVKALHAIAEELRAVRVAFENQKPSAGAV